MKLTEEQLTEVEKLSGACMKVPEICLIMGLDQPWFQAQLQIHNSPLYLAYQKGYLLTRYQVNRKIIDLAIAGSSPAQTITMKLIQDIELQDVS